MSMDAWLEAWDQQASNRSQYVLRGDASGFSDYPPIDLTLLRLRHVLGRSTRPGFREPRRGPSLHPTKGYRGAHKLFRGGSR